MLCAVYNRWGRCSVQWWGRCSVRWWGGCSVQWWGRCSVRWWGRCSVRWWGRCSVRWWGRCSVRWWGRCSVRWWGRCSVRWWGRCSVQWWGRCSVQWWGRCSVQWWGRCCSVSFHYWLLMVTALCLIDNNLWSVSPGWSFGLGQVICYQLDLCEFLTINFTYFWCLVLQFWMWRHLNVFLDLVRTSWRETLSSTSNNFTNSLVVHLE